MSPRCGMVRYVLSGVSRATGDTGVACRGLGALTASRCGWEGRALAWAVTGSGERRHDPSLSRPGKRSRLRMVSPGGGMSPW